jgi:putative oxidoreductase
MFKRLLGMRFIPTHPAFGLLLLRVLAAGPLFIHHGIEKLFGFSQMAANFPDPIHIGVIPSLLYAAFSDGICTLLLVLGLGTRWAAFFVFVNLFVAWSAFHHFTFLGAHNEHGELMVVYMGVMLAIIALGPGKYSVDNAIGA